MSIPPKPEESDENNIFISYNNYNCSYINAKLNTTTTTLFGKDIIGIRPTIDNGTISSRDTGENVSFLEEYSTGLSDTSGPIMETLNYEVRKERRKAEVLQHNNNNNNNIVNYETKKKNFSYFMKYGKSKFPGTSEVCNSNYNVEPVITSNSGIYGGRDFIRLNNIIDVQFFL